MTTDIYTIHVRREGIAHIVRWHAAHPLGVYAVLERWLREGVVDIREFGVLLDGVCWLAQREVSREEVL